MKREIYRLIEASIQHFGENIGNWEKCDIGTAINCLGSDFTIRDPKSMIWLRLGLHTLANAFVPTAERNEAATPKDPAIERITTDDLRWALENLTMGC